MNIAFYKYQGTGNDFVMIDDREETFDRNNTALVKHLCDRKFGIGADGCILLRLHPTYDFEMVYYNADGSESTMCGNGGRCTVQFAKALGIIESETEFLAVDGPHKAWVAKGMVTLYMQDVDSIQQHEEYIFIDTGSPHYVEFVEKVEEVDVVKRGREVRYLDTFKTIGGTNVNFAEEITPQQLKVRTYERGVENETLSCGTGVTACALAKSLKNGKSPISIETVGGMLEVGWEKTSAGYVNIYLKGPAKEVFQGHISV